MEYFYAQLNADSVVTQVITGTGADDEAQYTADTGVVHKRTEMRPVNGVHFRKNYAGIGYTFDPSVMPDGAFIPPRPFPSWTLNLSSCIWEAPVPMPEGGLYVWNEELGNWVQH